MNSNMVRSWIPLVSWDRIWPLSLPALWEASWRLHILENSYCSTHSTLAALCFTFLSACLVFSGFHLPFWTLSPLLHQPLCKVMCSEQQHTLLEKNRNVPVTPEVDITYSCLNWRSLKCPLFWCMYFHNFLLMPIGQLGHETKFNKVK